MYARVGLTARRAEWWRRLCPSSVIVAVVTALIVWFAIASFRAHPLMHTTGFLLATIPVVALMPTRPIDPVLITIYVCIGTLQHANVRWTFGPVGLVLVSPAYHRVHHSLQAERVNLGVVLTIWDVLAGCARFPACDQAVSPTGLASRPIPVEQAVPARPALLLLAEQLIEPFQARG
jgi:Fatty acid hydroxylase superfamily